MARWRVSVRAGTVLTCMAVLAAIAAAALSTAAEHPAQTAGSSHDPSTTSDDWPTQKHGVVLSLARRVGEVLSVVAMMGVVVVGYLILDVLVLVVTFMARLLLHATTSIGVAICLVSVLGVLGLYYFRYSYAAPKKSRPGADSDPRGSERFDLHPDVARSEDVDGADYMASLEARSKSEGAFDDMDPRQRRSHRQQLPGVGFPADFLNMFMKSISIFGYIEEPVFHEFSRQLQTRRLLAGERMFESEGDRDDQNFYVVIDGQVQIFLADDASRIPPAHADLTPSAGFSDADDAYEETCTDYGSMFHPEPTMLDGGRGAPIVHSEADSAILLNVVGPGDVLSSLFSILSLFTEDVPLRHRRSCASAGSSAGDLPPLGANPFDTIPAADSASVSGHGGLPQLPLRPNVVARATADTTLAMIPATAFQRVTRLYPQAAAHILQVILTRLQRVTFATLYDYLGLPDELVSIERAISDLARGQLCPEIAGSEVLPLVKDLYARHDEPVETSRQQTTTQSPVLGVTKELPFSSRTTPSAGRASRYSISLGSSSQLPAAWKINRENLEAVEKQLPSSRVATYMSPEIPIRRPLGTAEADAQGGGLNIVPSLSSQGRIRSQQKRHQRKRAGSDTEPPNALPSAADIDQLRKDVLYQLCASLGINPLTADGRHSPAHSPGLARPHGAATPLTTASTTSSSAHVSRRSSTHRKQLPRTEHLLPLLQSMVPSSEQRLSGSASSPKPLADIPSLTNELELYHLPDNFVLVEQGQRPQGLYIVLDGRIEITHRDSVGAFAGAHDGDERPGSAAPEHSTKERTISEITRRMTRHAFKARAQLERAQAARQRQPSTDATSPMSDHESRLSINSPRSRAASIADVSMGIGSPESTYSTQRRVCRSYHVGASDIVGYLPALTDMASLYTARSQGHAIVGFISHWALERICERYPIILMTLARRLTSRLPPAILNIDYALEWAQVRASQMVYRQGESSDAVYVVLSGRLRAFVEGQNGKVGILAEYGQGQSVGEPNLLLNEPCKFNLHAIRDTELVRIPRALFRALMQSAPGLTFHLSQTLAVRTAQSLQRLADQKLSTKGGLGASFEAGIRSHNKNLKSIALIPVDSSVPIHAFAEQLETALVRVAGGNRQVALLDHTAMSRVLGRHAFSRIARLKIVSWVAEMEQRCRLLLHVADGGISSPWTRHCVHHSDFVLLVGLGDSDPRVGEYERLLLALKTTARKELVLLHENRSCRTGVTREWLKRRPWVHAHHHIQMPLGYDSADFELAPDGTSHHAGILSSARSLISQSILRPSQRMLPALANTGLGRIRTSLERYYRNVVRGKQFTPTTYRGHRSDFARLARYLCGKSVGVVLSGGGARGIALLGVLQAFEEAGIPVDMIGGTSIGAFMSGLYAQTPDSVAIHGPLRAFSRRMSSMWRFLLDVTYPILAYTSGREFNRAIWKVFKDAEIEDLWLPFYCMTANITQSRSETHTSGLLWRVVRASMSLGGFVPPMCDSNGDLLVDGGYLDNLPVQVMKNELGASMIFAVDIAGENDTSPVRYGASVSGFWVLLNHLNPFRSYWIPTLSEVQSRLTYASSDKELESAKIADSCVYLRVPPQDVGVLDFGRFDELHRRGYEYAKRWTSEWQRAGLLDQWLPTNHKSSAARQISQDGMSVPTECKLTRRNSI
ncbi:Nte1p [Coemansia sp. RSA 552]|nr:Nte1p [Coemansia sp. RSA 552]